MKNVATPVVTFLCVGMEGGREGGGQRGWRGGKMEGGKTSTYQARSVEGFRTGPPPDMARRGRGCVVACAGGGRIDVVGLDEETEWGG